jgi:hypothetical protein
MRPRFLIFIFIIVLLLVALLFWQRPARPSAKTEQLPPAAQPASPPMNSNSPALAAPAIAQATVQAKLPSNIVTNLQAKREAMIEQDISGKNTPIDFYGLVIDQDGNPIPDVKIKSGVRHWKMISPEFGYVGSTTIQLEATTGTDGRFELTGASGDGFGVLLYKDGYEAESEKNGYGAGSYSYANPVIFKMWKTNIHEPLITGNKSFKIVPDGRSYFINLTDDTISESGPGDLRVWVKRPEQITYGTRYDWSSQLDVMDGGLQSASDYAMWMAPSDGYVPSFQFEQTIGSGWGDSTGERRFYVTLNNGQEYGHITIELYAYYNNQIPGLVRLSYAINPSGSRILR